MIGSKLDLALLGLQLRRCREGRRTACSWIRRCTVRPTKSECRRVRAVWPRARKLPSMMEPPVKLLRAPLPWFMRFLFGRPLPGRFAPRLPSSNFEAPGIDLGPQSLCNRRASSMPNSKPAHSGGIARAERGTSETAAFNLPIIASPPPRLRWRAHTTADAASGHAQAIGNPPRTQAGFVTPGVSLFKVRRR